MAELKSGAGGQQAVILGFKKREEAQAARLSLLQEVLNGCRWLNFGDAKSGLNLFFKGGQRPSDYVTFDVPGEGEEAGLQWIARMMPFWSFAMEKPEFSLMINEKEKKKKMVARTYAYGLEARRAVLKRL